MKRVHSCACAAAAIYALCATGCATTKTTVPAEPTPVVVEEPVVPEETVIPEPEPVAEPEPLQEPEPAPEPEPEPLPEPDPPEKTSEELEYERSVGQSTVSKDTFVEDKKSILRKIEELDVIMKNRNYDAWILYLDSESIDYWSRRPNLQKASHKLPVKSLRLNSLKDYFTFVFIPSRMGHTVDEIRYLTSASVKAVRTTEEKDIVYYNFKKVGGDWKVHLPTLEN